MLGPAEPESLARVGIDDNDLRCLRRAVEPATRVLIDLSFVSTEISRTE
jgi:hypothetical protein